MGVVGRGLFVFDIFDIFEIPKYIGGIRLHDISTVLLLVCEWEDLNFPDVHRLGFPVGVPSCPLSVSTGKPHSSPITTRDVRYVSSYYVLKDSVEVELYSWVIPKMPIVSKFMILSIRKINAQILEVVRVFRPILRIVIRGIVRIPYWDIVVWNVPIPNLSNPSV